MYSLLLETKWLKSCRWSVCIYLNNFNQMFLFTNSSSSHSENQYRFRTIIVSDQGVSLAHLSLLTLAEEMKGNEIVWITPISFQLTLLSWEEGEGRLSVIFQVLYCNHRFFFPATKSVNSCTRRNNSTTRLSVVTWMTNFGRYISERRIGFNNCIA